MYLCTYVCMYVCVIYLMSVKSATIYNLVPRCKSKLTKKNTSCELNSR